MDAKSAAWRLLQRASARDDGGGVALGKKLVKRQSEAPLAAIGSDGRSRIVCGHQGRCCRGTNALASRLRCELSLPGLEPFMNERQREYFREKLMNWRDDVLNEAKRPLQPLLDEQSQSDITDRASSETDRELELRARERQRKLISKIDAALARFEDGTYGFCEEIGEPISLRRLEARPIATLSVEAQERHERQEKLHRAVD